ncbi:MAG TPA: outer membrane protein assembly factor BamD [Rhodanobacteraceae bacterium]|nr:outer membrane protein assembly factor BamD [Rhodanobacteraceae bacterium]
MRLFKLFCVVAFVFVLASCAMFKSRGDLNAMPVAKLYQTAHQSLRDGDYLYAEQAYKRLIARFPYGEYNQQAQIEMAYAQYKDGKPDDAYSTINRFIKTFPAHKHIAYAYYLRGLINFDRAGHFAQRIFGRDARSRHDQGYRLESFDDFSKLTRRFPDSKYAADARQRMIYLRNGLAQFEINVAEFYLHTRAYVAAAHRAKYVIQHYQQAPQVADALAIEAISYRKLNMDKLAQQTLAVLKLNYPDHPYLTDPGWPHTASTLRRMIPFSGHH